MPIQAKDLKKLHSDSSGFSLIELLVVVLIIGVLAAIMIPRFISQRDASANQAAVQTLKNAETILLSFHTANDRFSDGSGPGSIPDLIDSLSGPNNNPAQNTSGNEGSIVWENGVANPVAISGNSNDPGRVKIYALVAGRFGGAVLCVGSKSTKNYCTAVFGNKKSIHYTVTGDDNRPGSIQSNEFGSGSGVGILEGGSPSTPASFQPPSGPGTWTEGWGI